MQKKSGAVHRFGGHGPFERRRGVTAVEVIVVVVILTMFALIVVTALPRQRETARLASCRGNLRKIGVALVLYDQMAGHLPMIPELGADRSAPPAGPLRVLLETLGLPDLTEVSEAKNLPGRRPGVAPGERPITGFVCTSDPKATAGLFPAPISYRATTGDRPSGATGAFAPGRLVSLATIEAGDGIGYTAGFSERLVGNTRNAPASNNYAIVSSPLSDAGCPQPGPSAWHGDAGSSWVVSDWRSTLYNHVLTPDQAPSCLADDGRSAAIGASSGHPNGVNVLILDGGVRTYTPQVDPQVWRELATANPAATPPGPGTAHGTARASAKE